MRRTDREVARSLDASPGLLPFLPALLAGLGDMGGSVGPVLALLRPLGLPEGARALDLGCGMGAMAVVLAKRLGLRVLGVDAFAPFIRAARLRAKEAGIGRLCRFRCSDLREALRGPAEFDLVLWIGVGPLLGDHSALVGRLRRRVRPGGYLVIDDAFLAPTVGKPPSAYRSYAPHPETIRRLLSHGDALLAERIFPASHEARVNARNTASIRRRAVRLARQHPESASALLGYVRAQDRAVARSRGALRMAVWVIRRRERSGLAGRRLVSPAGEA